MLLWEGAGGSGMTVFRPTLLALERGAPAPLGAGRPPYYWRRLQPLADLAGDGDYPWTEPADTRDGAVLWAVLEPASHAVVAAAVVESPSRE